MSDEKREMKEQQIRTIAHAVVSRVVMELAGEPDRISSALDAAYPFGERSGFAYQIWREEARRVGISSHAAA